MKPTNHPLFCYEGSKTSDRERRWRKAPALDRVAREGLLKRRVYTDVRGEVCFRGEERLMHGGSIREAGVRCAQVAAGHEAGDAGCRQVTQGLPSIVRT